MCQLIYYYIILRYIILDKRRLGSLLGLRRLGGARVLLTEILLPRIARKGAVCLISISGQARKARIEKSELDEGFQLYHPPFQFFPAILANY